MKSATWQHLNLTDFSSKTVHYHSIDVTPLRAISRGENCIWKNDSNNSWPSFLYCTWEFRVPNSVSFCSQFSYVQVKFTCGLLLPKSNYTCLVKLLVVWVSASVCVCVCDSFAAGYWYYKWSQTHNLHYATCKSTTLANCSASKK